MSGRFNVWTGQPPALACHCGRPATLILYSQIGGPQTGFCDEHRPLGFRTDASTLIAQLRDELAAANAIAEPARRWADLRMKMHGREGLELFRFDAEEARKEEQAVFDARRKELGL